MRTIGQFMENISTLMRFSEVYADKNSSFYLSHLDLVSSALIGYSAGC